MHTAHRRVQDCFMVYTEVGKQTYFHQEQMKNLRVHKGWKAHIFSSGADLLKNFLPLGQIMQEAEKPYYIIHIYTHYAPNKCFFIKGGNILLGILSGTFLCFYAVHACETKDLCSHMVSNAPLLIIPLGT